MLERPCLTGRKWQSGLYPAGGRAARDARFLSHAAVECQSKPGMRVVGYRRRNGIDPAPVEEK
jgi:hypothetical protein